MLESHTDYSYIQFLISLLLPSGAKPYSCDFCDKSYTDNYSLKQHVARIHPDVATSLPHLMITPRTRGEQDDSGFKSMVKDNIVLSLLSLLQPFARLTR